MKRILITALILLTAIAGQAGAFTFLPGGGIPNTYLDTDGTLAANSDTKVATQKATKTYSDTKVSGAGTVTANNFVQFSDTTGKAIKGGLALTTSTTLAGNSDANIPSEKAVKAYADTKLTTPGAWTTPTFAAGDFTASSNMTWTVEAADVETFAYTIQGKVMTVCVSIGTSTVGGTPDTTLLIKIPDGKTATKTIHTTATLYDNSAWSVGKLYTTAGSTNLWVRLIGEGNWTAAADAVYVRGQITFEIN
jgi:hypothetical protein